MEHNMTAQQILDYGKALAREERAGHTIEKYLHSVRQFHAWLAGRPVTKETVTSWKEWLCQEGNAPGTVNTALAALHGFFRYIQQYKSIAFPV